MHFELEYEAREFPAYFEWMHLREGAYAVGFEPSTNHVSGEAAATSRPPTVQLLL